MTELKKNLQSVIGHLRILQEEQNSNLLLIIRGGQICVSTEESDLLPTDVVQDTEEFWR